MFVAALTIREYERTHEYHEALHGVAEMVEHLLMVAIMVLFGGALANGLLAPLTLETIVRVDVIVSVAEIPLIGIKLTAAIAGMETMTDYGLFEEWDTDRRGRAVERRQYGRRKQRRS